MIDTDTLFFFDGRPEELALYEALLEKIPEATEEEVTNFFSSTESDETLDHNPALEAEMVVIDMLISA